MQPSTLISCQLFQLYSKAGSITLHCIYKLTASSDNSANCINDSTEST